MFDKGKQFADAEATFRELLKRDPENAAAMNYLGYMLAERGERLDESIGLLQKALAMEPDNGSYLDSLGWAYYKEDKLDLAEDNLKRAADQQKTNSVIQDHYARRAVQARPLPGCDRRLDTRPRWRRRLDRPHRHRQENQIGEAEARKEVRRVVCLLAALVACSCARHGLKLPTGAGEPASDGREALAQATGACAAIRTFTAEVGLSGKIHGQRLRAHLLLGAAAPASARVEAVAPIGAPIFIFIARGSEATLLMPRDNRVLQHARPDDVLGAIAGVPLTPEELRFTLTGCWPPVPDVSGARRFGDSWRVIDISGKDTVTLHRARSADPWRIAAAVRHDQQGGRWQATYDDFQHDLPHAIRISSAAASGGSAYDLQLSLSQLETNVPLDDEAFRVKIPGDAAPISLDELRRARPGAGKN